MDHHDEESLDAIEAARPYEAKTMYHVEKFLPVECPKCRHPFQKVNTDWHRLLGDIIDGKKVFRALNGYHIIVCAKCENYTAQIPLESYQLADKAQAQKLCDEAGFVNLTEVFATGTHCRDMHTVYCKPPGITIIGVEPPADHLEADQAEIRPIGDAK